MTDQLHPFLLNEKPIRGRVVRLSGAASQILNQHRYPEPISALLAEALVMAAIFSSNLKGEGGVFTIQLQSKGALSVLLADATADGALRGYAQFDPEADLSQPLTRLCPEGFLAITFDPGAGGKRYQGVVPLEGESIAESMQQYFSQSQQLDVQCKLAVSHDEAGWKAAGALIERMPEENSALGDEAWREAHIMLLTLKGDELLDEGLAAEQLLYRLFHEDGVWVYDPHALRAECRCSRAKIMNALSGMQPEALAEMAEEGRLTVDCQFCGSQEVFALSELNPSC